MRWLSYAGGISFDASGFCWASLHPRDCDISRRVTGQSNQALVVAARKSLYPRILPHPPVPHAIPMPLPKRRSYRTLNTFRDIFSEMDDLSDEENELDDEIQSVTKRGFNFLILIGRSLTQQEEKNDEDSEDSSQQSGGAASLMEDEGENESNQDLDASMEDLDEDLPGDSDDNVDMNEDETEELEEEPSDVS